MPIEFACESCKKLLRVPNDTAGLSCQCPACAAILQIPDPGLVGMVEVVESDAGQRSLTIPCPKCRSLLEVSPQLLGTKGQCRHCHYIFRISADPDEAGTATEAQVTGLTFSCPRCKQLFEGQEEMRGRKGRCHMCGEVFTIELEQVDQPETAAFQQLPAPEGRSSTGVRPATSAALKKELPSSTLDSSDHRDGHGDSDQGDAAADQSGQTLPLRLACPACRGVMEVPANAGGKMTACPHCEQLLQIPTSTPSQAKMSRQADGTSREPSDLWTELEEEIGIGSANPYAPSDTSTPTTQAGSDIWMRTGATSGRLPRGGLSFLAAYQLAFERSFPECLAATLIYVAISAAATAASYGTLFGLGVALQAASVSQDTAVLIVGATMVVIGLLLIALGTAGLCMICNGALVTMRQQRADAAELFSTGGFMMPMLFFVLLATLAGGVVGGIPQVVAMTIGTHSPTLTVVAAVAMLPLSMVLTLGICLAPLAIVDGQGPFEAIATSFQIFLSHPLTMLAIVLVLGLGYVAISALTCGLAGVVLLGFPYYLLAACYHLATR